jgi:hypothetical protein
VTEDGERARTPRAREDFEWFGPPERNTLRPLCGRCIAWGQYALAESWNGESRVPLGSTREIDPLLRWPTRPFITQGASWLQEGVGPDRWVQHE